MHPVLPVLTVIARCSERPQLKTSASGQTRRSLGSSGSLGKRGSSLRCTEGCNATFMQFPPKK